MKAALSRALPWADLSLAWNALHSPSKLGVGVADVDSDSSGTASVETGLVSVVGDVGAEVVAVSLAVSLGVRLLATDSVAWSEAWSGKRRQVAGGGHGESAGGEGDDDAGRGDGLGGRAAAEGGRGHEVAPRDGWGQSSSVEHRNRGLLTHQGLAAPGRSLRCAEHRAHRTTGRRGFVEQALGLAAGQGSGFVAAHVTPSASRSGPKCYGLTENLLWTPRTAVARVP